MDGTSDDEDEERMPNGDLSRDLRQDDDDLRDPVNVSWVVLNYLTYQINFDILGTFDPRREKWKITKSVAKFEGWIGWHQRWPGNVD